MRGGLRAIALTGLIVGAMDITAACIQAMARGATPIRLLQFVASGLLGAKAFQGGWTTAAVGLALHFAIAFAVVIVFYVVSHQLQFLQNWPVTSGVLYGLIVWAVMNLIVLPLSAATPRHSLTGDLIQIAIHMFVIGLPTSLLLRRFSGAPRS